MCESRLQRVLAVSDGAVRVEQVDGREATVSLLAFDGPVPGAGDWVVVHSGYALHAVDATEATEALAELRALRASRGAPVAPPHDAPAWPRAREGNDGAHA